MFSMNLDIYWDFSRHNIIVYNILGLNLHAEYEERDKTI